MAFLKFWGGTQGVACTKLAVNLIFKRLTSEYLDCICFLRNYMQLCLVFAKSLWLSANPLLALVFQAARLKLSLRQKKILINCSPYSLDSSLFLYSGVLVSEFWYYENWLILCLENDVACILFLFGHITFLLLTCFCNVCFCCDVFLQINMFT